MQADLNDHYLLLGYNYESGLLAQLRNKNFVSVLMHNGVIVAPVPHVPDTPLSNKRQRVRDKNFDKNDGSRAIIDKTKHLIQQQPREGVCDG